MLKCQQPAIEAGVYGVRGVESRALGAHQAIGTGRRGRHVKGFSGETSPSVVSKYQGGGEHVHQRMSQGAGTEVVPGPALDNVPGLFFVGTLLSCPQGDVSVTCAFAVGERFPGVSRFGALARPLRGA